MRTAAVHACPMSTPTTDAAATYTAFTLDVDDGVARIRLAQDERGNPFDETFCADLAAVITECDVRDDVRCVLISGAGRFFSVGGDLRSMTGGRGRFTAEHSHYDPVPSHLGEKVRSNASGEPVRA